MLKSGLLGIALVLGLAASSFAQGTFSTAHWISLSWWERDPVGNGRGWGGAHDQIADALVVERKTWFREAGTTNWIERQVLTSGSAPVFSWESHTNSITIPRDRDLEVRARVRWFRNDQWFFNEVFDVIPGE